MLKHLKAFAITSGYVALGTAVIATTLLMDCAVKARKAGKEYADELRDECPYDEPLHNHHDGCPACDMQ